MNRPAAELARGRAAETTQRGSPMAALALTASVAAIATKGLGHGWLCLPLAALIGVRAWREWRPSRGLAPPFDRGLWGFACALGLLLLGTLVGLWPSVDRAASLQRLWGVALGIVLCLGLAWELRSPRALARYLGWLTLAGAFVCLFGMVQVDANAWKLNALNRPVYQALAHVPRLTDDAIHQNGLAAFIVPLLPLSLAAALTCRDVLWRVAMLTGSVVMALTLLLTASRGGAAGAAIALLAFCLALIRPRLLPVVVLLVLSAPALLLLPGQAGAGSDAERLALWRAGLALARQVPWTGIGGATFPLVLPLVMPPSVAASYPQAHNVFLQAWLDGGIAGLAGVGGLALWWGRTVACRHGRILAAGAWAACAGLLLHSQVDCPWLGDSRIVFYLLLPFGLLAACGRTAGRPGVTSVRGQGCLVLRGTLVTRHPSLVITGAWLALVVVAAIAAWPAHSLAWVDGQQALLDRTLSTQEREARRATALASLGDGALQSLLAAELRQQAGQTEAARRGLAKAARRDPGGRAALELGWSAFGDGENAGALAAWRTLADDEQLRWRLLLLEAQGRLAQAERLAGLLRAAFPHDPRLVEDVEDVCWRLAAAPPVSAPPRARRAWAEANPEGDYWRGVELRWEGDLAGAAAALRWANRRVPNNPLFRAELAETLLQAGDVQGAAGQYRALLAFEPGNLVARARLEGLGRAQAGGCVACWAAL